MSGASESKWRRGAPTSRPSPSASNANASPANEASQQRQTSSGVKSPEPGPQKNAWGSNNSRAGSSTPGSGAQSPRTGPTGAGGVSGAPQHNAMQNAGRSDGGAKDTFTGWETREWMRKKYRDAIAAAGGDEKAAIYKPVTEASAPKAAWGARPKTMANGRDFWIELQKQIKAFEERDK